MKALTRHIQSLLIRATLLTALLWMVYMSARLPNIHSSTSPLIILSALCSEMHREFLLMALPHSARAVLLRSMQAQVMTATTGTPRQPLSLLLFPQAEPI